jgi:hypothetical protein
VNKCIIFSWIRRVLRLSYLILLGFAADMSKQ